MPSSEKSRVIRVEKPEHAPFWTIADNYELAFRTKADAHNYVNQHALIEQITLLIARLKPEYRHELQDVADNLLRAAYFRHVRKIADEIEDAVRLSQIRTEVDLTGALIERISRSVYLVGVGRNLEALRCSGHPNAYIDEHDGEAPCDEGVMAWHQLAFWAVLCDVQDMLPSWEEMHPG